MVTHCIRQPGIQDERDVSQFSADWLALREPLDAASRAADLAQVWVEHRAGQARDSRLEVVDLGAGTGANLRYLAPLLGGSQQWLLVEQDPLLLDALPGRMRTWVQTRAPQVKCDVRSIALDLATRLDQLPLPNGCLITASALLDLVSEPWLRALAERAASAAATVWFALTYDGRIQCSPAEPEDAEVRELFNAHQLTDKGFGPALGPGAARMAQQLFLQHGYRVHCAPSDWHIGADQPALQHALLQGWCDAACEIARGRTAALRSWLARRQRHAEAGRSQLLVGHVDMLGSPMAAAKDS